MSARNKNIFAGILVGVLGTLAVVFRKPIAGFLKQWLNGTTKTQKNSANKDE